MSDDMISQEEIDALLNGGSSGDDKPAGDDKSADGAAAAGGASSTSDVEITDIERDALGEIGNISMGGAATTLSVLLGCKVSITTPTVSISNMSQLKEKYRSRSWWSKSVTASASKATTFFASRRRMRQSLPI